MSQSSAGKDSADRKRSLTPTGEATARSPQSEARWQREVNRCRAEIAATESLLLAGHPDAEGLCLALADWSAELGILEAEATAAWSWNSAGGGVYGWPSTAGGGKSRICG